LKDPQVGAAAMGITEQCRLSDAGLGAKDEDTASRSTCSLEQPIDCGALRIPAVKLEALTRFGLRTGAANAATHLGTSSPSEVPYGGVRMPPNYHEGPQPSITPTPGRVTAPGEGHAVWRVVLTV
jgi:hypothetical protein